MKKLFTLMIAFSILTVANAQRGVKHKRGTKVAVNFSVYPIAKKFKGNMQMQRAIFFINRKYNRRIRYVKNNFYMRPIVKMKKIRKLNRQRRFEIARIKQFYARNYWYGMARF